MSPDERARVVVALDHDSRQPQHALEMGLRNLRLLVAEASAQETALISQIEPLRRMQEELASVQAAARQIVDTQQDLVDAIRLEFDDTRPTPRTIRAHDLIARAIKGNRALATNVTLRGSPSRLAFVADERWMERILNNLICNAIWHSGASRILVCARRRGDSVVFEVRDNGRGMPQERVDQVFEPLRTPALSSVGRSTAHSGLGLYNVRLFAERMGGSVHCDSTTGLGTRFRVWLPGPVATLEVKPWSREREKARSISSKMVAVLDDDDQVLRTTERVFENLGIEVYADHDPLRWLNVVTELERMPDLFLLDFQLKGQDCSLQLDIIRRRWANARPKVIVITGHANDPRLLKIARIVPVLRKPMSDPKFDLILEILSGMRNLPEAGFL